MYKGKFADWQERITFHMCNRYQLHDIFFVERFEKDMNAYSVKLWRDWQHRYKIQVTHVYSK